MSDESPTRMFWSKALSHRDWSASRDGENVIVTRPGCMFPIPAENDAQATYIAETLNSGGWVEYCQDGQFRLHARAASNTRALLLTWFKGASCGEPVTACSGAEQITVTPLGGGRFEIRASDSAQIELGDTTTIFVVRVG